jgi:hypothetical protein
MRARRVRAAEHGDGLGNFVSTTSVVIGTNSNPDAWRVAVVDLDGDLLPDLVVLRTDNTITVIRQTSLGNFDVPGAITLTLQPGTQPSEIRIVDVNGDGQKDLVVTASGGPDNGFVVFKNVSTSGSIAFTGFAAPSYDHYATAGAFPKRAVAGAIVTAHTSTPDLAVTTNNGAEIFLNDGTGKFTTGVVVAASGVHQVALGQFKNVGGHLDLVFASLNVASQPTVTIIPGNGDGTFAAPLPAFFAGSVAPGNADDIVAVDVDGDGKLDVVSSGNTGACVLYGNGNQGLGGVVELGIGNTSGGLPQHITFGDVNGDGIYDFGFGGHNQGGLHVLFGKK